MGRRLGEPAQDAAQDHEADAKVTTALKEMQEHRRDTMALTER